VKNSHATIFHAIFNCSFHIKMLVEHSRMTLQAPYALALLLGVSGSEEFNLKILRDIFSSSSFAVAISFEARVIAEKNHSTVSLGDKLLGKIEINKTRSWDVYLIFHHPTVPSLPYRSAHQSASSSMEFLLEFLNSPRYLLSAADENELVTDNLLRSAGTDTFC
jgi:hypothetical protein